MRAHTARAHAEGGEGLNQAGDTAPREGSKLKRMNAEPFSGVFGTTFEAPTLNLLSE